MRKALDVVEEILSDARNDFLSRFLQDDSLKIGADERNYENGGVGDDLDVKLVKLKIALTDHLDKVTHNDG